VDDPDPLSEQRGEGEEGTVPYAIAILSPQAAAEDRCAAL